MARVSNVTICKLQDFINSLPAEVKAKCSLCNETLTHVIKSAEVQTGAGTATVAKSLADEINQNSLPADRVTGKQLQDRTRRRSE